MQVPTSFIQEAPAVLDDTLFDLVISYLAADCRFSCDSKSLGKAAAISEFRSRLVCNHLISGTIAGLSPERSARLLNGTPL